MRTRPLALIAVATGLVLGAACGSSSGGEAAPTTTVAVTTTAAPTTAAPTTVAPATATPSTVAPTTVAPATAPTSEPETTVDPSYIPTDPDAYADFFIKAWAAGDRTRALKFGSASAVDTLFAYEAGGEEGAPPPDWQVVECEGAAGSSYCTFSAGGDPKIIVRVMNEAASQGQPQAISEVQIKD